MAEQSPYEAAAASVFSQYISAALGRFGLGTQRQGRMAQRAALALAARANAIAMAQLRATQQATRVAVQAATMPGSGWHATTFYPSTPLDPKLAKLNVKIARIDTALQRREARRQRNVGDRLLEKQRKLQKKAAKLEQKRELTGTTVFYAAYGLNNPIIAGSRDDPRGAIRPAITF